MSERERERARERESESERERVHTEVAQACDTCLGGFLALGQT